MLSESEPQQVSGGRRAPDGLWKPEPNTNQIAWGRCHEHVAGLFTTEGGIG